MDWTVWAPILTGLGGLIVGVTPSVKRWLDARAKKVEAEAEQVTASATTRDKEVTAKVRLVEAQAEATKAEAAMDQATADEVKALRRDVDACREEHKACTHELATQKRWAAREIKQLQGDLDTLFVKSGLTPRDRTQG